MQDARGPARSSPWIVGPVTDLVCFGFGWVPAFLIFATPWIAQMGGLSSFLAFSIFLFNFLHRHLTFPLVYGDPEQFGRHRLAYVALPPFFIVSVLSIYWLSPQLFYVVETVAILWTVYHVIMQKAGLLRIYSRKSGARLLWLDKALPLLWLAAGAAFAPPRPASGTTCSCSSGSPPGRGGPCWPGTRRSSCWPGC